MFHANPRPKKYYLFLELSLKNFKLFGNSTYGKQYRIIGDTNGNTSNYIINYIINLKFSIKFVLYKETIIYLKI